MTGDAESQAGERSHRTNWWGHVSLSIGQAVIKNEGVLVSVMIHTDVPRGCMEPSGYKTHRQERLKKLPVKNIFEEAWHCTG